jgi:hypothetical protein
LLNFVEVKGKQSSLKGTEGEKEQPGEEDRGYTSEKKKVDGGDIVKEEKDQMKTAKHEEHGIVEKDAKKEHEPTVYENRMQEREEKELKEDVEKDASPTLAVDQTTCAPAPVSGGDIKKGGVIIDNKTGTDKISGTLLTCHLQPYMKHYTSFYFFHKPI